jgi:hypothetical protein
MENKKINNSIFIKSNNRETENLTGKEEKELNKEGKNVIFK